MRILLKNSRATLVFGLLISFSTIVYGQVVLDEAKREPYLTTNKDNETCLHTYNFLADKVVTVCDSSVLTEDERLQMEKVKLREAARREKLLKIDSRTPKFNKCVELFDENYYYVRNNCMLDLISDLSPLSGWFSFSKSKAAQEAEQSAYRRINEMKIIADLRIKEILNEQGKRRIHQTPLENAIDKLNEPCLYADRDNIMRSCD